MNGKTVDLGWFTAKYNDGKNHGPKLTILCPSDAGEGGYSPAESVTIYSDSAIIRLRDFLIEVLPKPEATG